LNAFAKQSCLHDWKIFQGSNRLANCKMPYEFRIQCAYDSVTEQSSQQAEVPRNHKIESVANTGKGKVLKIGGG
jgi:hypothetical protein